MKSQSFPQHDYSYVLLTTMKDEAPYILDWIAYHLAIGFTHFVVLTNDCSDGTEKILRHLEKIGVVTQKNNPAPHPRGPQKNGYLRMRKLDAVQNAGWLMALDVDEYLQIDVGNGHLSDLMTAIGTSISAVSFVWQLFGNGGVEHILDAPVIAQFSKAAHPLQARPYECLPFKTLYKNGYFQKIGTHRPNDFIVSKQNEFEWIDADGVSIKPFTKYRHWCAHATGLGFGTALGRINHYALRSTDAFANKWIRGFVHPDAPTVRGKGSFADYWKLFNWNDVHEDKIMKHVEAVEAYKSALKSIPRITDFHQKGLEYHQEKAREMRASNFAFFEQLRGLGSSKLSDDLPDFSKHGSPHVGNIPYVSAQNLNQKLQSTLLLGTYIKSIVYDNPQI